MLPLVAHQLWTAYQVLHASTKISTTMCNNVQQLKKLHSKMIELGLDEAEYSLGEVVAGYKGKRWGVRLCGYAIDEQFWEVFTFWAGILAMFLLLVVPLIIYFVYEDARRKKQQEEVKQHLREREAQKAEADRLAGLLSENARVVDQTIKPTDLRTLPEDKSKGFRDWRKCFVGGDHLKAWSGGTAAFASKVASSRAVKMQHPLSSL